MSTFFDESHIRQILQAINIVDVVGNYVALKPKGREMLGLCPFHDDSRPSLSVSPAKQIFKCFSCGAGGDVIKFMMLRERLSFPEAVELLAARAGVQLPARQELPDATKSSRKQLEAANLWAARFFRSEYDNSEIGARARQYVETRGIKPEVARRFGLGWARPEWDCFKHAAEQSGISAADFVRAGLLIQKEQGGFYDRFRERLMFPVFDVMGRVIAFGGRTLGDDPAKYLNSPESALFNKSESLYGLHAAKDAIVKEHTAVVVEGYTDCIMAHQFGVNNVVATLGTALTSEHVRALARYAERIILVFDSDAAGQKAADRAIELFFAQRVQLRLVALPEEKDPCDYLLLRGGEAFRTLLEQAVEALEYKWRNTFTQLTQTDTVNGRKRAVDEFLALIAKGLDQEHIDAISEGFLLGNVAKMVETPLRQVIERVKGLRQHRPRRSETAKPAAAASLALPTDNFSRSQQAILEVLLNEPSLLPRVQESIKDLSEFRDPVLRQVAQRLWSAAQQDSIGSLAEILAAVESPDLCALITDMAQRGAERGNLETTLEGALANVQRLKEKESQRELAELVSTAASKYGPDVETATLNELYAKLKLTHVGPRPDKTT